MPLGIELRYRGVHPKAIRGLFHGKQIQHGFQCVDKGKRPRTRRDWKPNVQYKHLFSEALKCQVKVCVTTHALKRIDRAGGLDMYLLTVPAASRGSIVADELRKSIIKEYRDTKQGVPQKEGHTSILSIVDQRLRDAGLRPQIAPSRAKGPLGDSSASLEASAASEPSSATSPKEHLSVNAVSGSGAESLGAESLGTLPSEQQEDSWKPIVTVPHQDAPYRMRSQRKSAIIQHILEQKGFSGALSAGSMVTRSELAQARRLAIRKIKSLNRHQLLAKLPADSRKQLKRSLEARKRVCLLHRRRFSKDLSSGKRVSKPLLEAMRKAKMEWRRKITRRNNLVATLRGQARNEVLKRIASNVEASMLLRFEWLQTFVEEMPPSPGKEAWRALADKYQPTTPGMLVDGVFVPASNRHRVASTKEGAQRHPELPPVSPPFLEPPTAPSPDSSTPPATAEDILKAANAVAFLPEDSDLLVKDTGKKIGLSSPGKARRIARSKWREAQMRQYHADKLYQLMRDMKLEHPRHADAIERRITDRLKSLGPSVDAQAGVVDAYVRNRGINGTVRALLQATVARRARNNGSRGGDGTASHIAAASSTGPGGPAEGGAAGGAPAGAAAADTPSKRGSVSGLGAAASASGSQSAPADGADGKRGNEGRSRGGVRHLITQRMTYAERRKLTKMSKWLDDAWLRRHVVCDTMPDRLVLGNGMIVPARSRRPCLPERLQQQLEDALESIEEEEVANSLLKAPEPAGGWAVNAQIDGLPGGPPRTLPGPPGSWVPR